MSTHQRSISVRISESDYTLLEQILAKRQEQQSDMTMTDLARTALKSFIAQQEEILGTPAYVKKQVRNELEANRKHIDKLFKDQSDLMTENTERLLHRLENAQSIITMVASMNVLNHYVLRDIHGEEEVPTPKEYADSVVTHMQTAIHPILKQINDAQKEKKGK